MFELTLTVNSEGNCNANRDDYELNMLHPLRTHQNAAAQLRERAYTCRLTPAEVNAISPTPVYPPGYQYCACVN